MAFVDFYAAGGAPVGTIHARENPQARGWLRPRPRPAASRSWRWLLGAAVALPAIAAPAIVIANFFDDAMLGALAAVLLYAAGAPIVSWLANDRASPRGTSY